jgi:hypothetical protein
MTIADQARNLAISLEAKKDALAQRQSGDWKVSFTVQGVDMDARLTQAPMGTRFAMVLVEIGDNEEPVAPKVVAPASPGQVASKPDRVKREKMDWRDVQPAAQAGIRCGEPAFRAFLREVKQCALRDNDPESMAWAVRELCGVQSRVELGTKHAARVLWHQLDSEYQAWLAKERVGA